MNVKKKARRVMSGLLTAVTVLSTVLSPAVAYASDDAGSVKKIPYYEEIKDQLDEDEVVTAKDYEIKVGDNFDVKSDYTGLTIQDDSKVKVTFQEAKDTDGNDFSTDYANSYKAVYYVEPQTTDHPTYQINRKIVVKEADQQKDSQSESSSDQDAGSSDKTETEDSEAGSSTEETGAADTESKTELTEKEFDAEIEATEDQETVDPETGITLSEVMQEAVDQEVALADLEAGESITFDMPMMLASGETGTKSVTVTAGSWYYYADYGLGSYLTCPYYVKWGSINATAYCVEPSKKGPGNGTYTIQKLADGKTLAKVCYYGTKASDENGFFDEKHPDFPAGKRFIITHIAAAYANGSSDWASGTNATGKNLAMELYNYCVNMPDIPSVDMSFSESNVKAYVEGNSQRTSVITFKADKLQTITFKLPSGVKLVNVTTGKTSAAGASVEISGGTQFYLTAPLDQAESVCSSFGLDTSDYSFPYIAGWSSSREMKEMKASMDVIRKTAGEMIDQLTEELEIILEEKQKTELHDKYGILVDALEAAGYRYDYRESEPGHIVLAPDGTHEIAGYLQFESWGDIKDWLEDTIAEGTDVSERVDRAMYPFKYDYTLEEEMFRGNGDRYAIYHVDEDTPGKQYLFMNMAMVKEDGITIDAENYKCVYSGRLHENEKLDDLYAVFNDNPPADYKAHSMSVSDVIITNRGGGICRHITWIDLDLQNFQTLQHKEKKYSILSRRLKM